MATELLDEETRSRRKGAAVARVASPSSAGSKGIKAEKIDASLGGRPSRGIVRDVDAALTPALPAT